MLKKTDMEGNKVDTIRLTISILVIAIILIATLIITLEKQGIIETLLSQKCDMTFKKMKQNH